MTLEFTAFVLWSYYAGEWEYYPYGVIKISAFFKVGALCSYAYEWCVFKRSEGRYIWHRFFSGGVAQRGRSAICSLALTRVFRPSSKPPFCPYARRLKTSPTRRRSPSLRGRPRPRAHASRRLHQSSNPEKKCIHFRVAGSGQGEVSPHMHSRLFTWLHRASMSRFLSRFVVSNVGFIFRITLPAKCKMDAAFILVIHHRG